MIFEAPTQTSELFVIDKSLLLMRYTMEFLTDGISTVPIGVKFCFIRLRESLTCIKRNLGTIGTVQIPLVKNSTAMPSWSVDL